MAATMMMMSMSDDDDDIRLDKDAVRDDLRSLDNTNSPNERWVLWVRCQYKSEQGKKQTRPNAQRLKVSHLWSRVLGGCVRLNPYPTLVCRSDGCPVNVRLAVR